MRSLRTPLGRGVAASLVGVLGLLGGCGDASSSDGHPALTSELREVDAAIGSGDAARARAAVDRLLAAADEAHAAGELSAEDLSRIRDAAQAVVAALPTPPPATPPPEPPAEADPGPTEGDEKEKDEQDEDDKEDKEDQDDKDDRKEQEGSGSSTGNGRDDGNGNEQ